MWELEGHLLIIYKALYGFRLSGKLFGQLLQECLQELGFEPSLAESTIYMRKCPTADHYEYVATYVVDLCMMMKDPQSLLEQLMAPPYTFKLKGSGELAFHLGCGFQRDSTGTLCMDPGKYIDRMEDLQHFKTKPVQRERSPLQKGDHPELDTSPFLDENDKEIYMSLVGSAQWSISIGCFDIQSAIMTMSKFCSAPRSGHLDRMKQIIRYLCKFQHYKIRFQVDKLDYSNVPGIKNHDWEHSVYGNHEEDIPIDTPLLLGKKIVLTHYFDASLMHNVLSGKAITGVCTFYNKTPVDWFCKQQSTSETATYGAEFLSGRKVCEMIIDHRSYLRYLGKPVHDMDYVWGDNRV